MAKALNKITWIVKIAIPSGGMELLLRLMTGGSFRFFGKGHEEYFFARGKNIFHH